ncbi:MAG: hypothetical protein QOJ02_2139 [Acidobacteriota bacterium]|nr:hypothetical protein [Acidobacteriota bacterium]
MKLFSSIKNFFASFSERAKLFLIVFFCSLLAVGLSIWIGGVFAATLVTVPAILGILQITKEVWSPEGGKKSKVALASLGIAIIFVVSGGVSQPIADTLLEPIYSLFPSLRGKLPSSQPSALVLAFLALIIFIVNYFSRDTTAMKQHPTPIEKEFPEKDYKDLLKSFCGLLLDEIRKIDRETNWSAELFIPLDAEVEIRSRESKLRRITDLLSAIRLDRTTRAFLVLGDPGSGKSVALRKLCIELLGEVEKTGKVPLYINLKEWNLEEKWTEKKPPTVEQLYNFVLTNLKNRGDMFTNDFLDKYFKKMLEDGRLFLILDSFDEIPAVLDEAESSWLIDELSSVIYRFISGAHHSRGVLASRIFRRPTGEYDARTILEIRPLSEKKIVQTLRKSLSFKERLVTELFTVRRELVPIARNPFLATLISNYAKEHNNTLPSTQAELYASYIQRRLEASEDKIQKKGLTRERVIEACTEIAYLMFTSEISGLEVSVKYLTHQLPNIQISDVIDVLTYTRLGRLGAGTEQRFSFVHRRFNEYFVVQKLMQNPRLVSLETIPKDSRLRDALVLYCEVTDDHQAKEIAEFCWLEISKATSLASDVGDQQYLRAVHCLRFLRDAFRTRIRCIDQFRDSLGGFISSQISSGKDLLSQKLVVEAIGLLREKDIESSTLAALSINNQWISDTALKACYYLPELTLNIRKSLKLYIDSIDIPKFIKQRSDLIFSFKLSNIFIELKTFCNLRLLDCVGLFMLSLLVLVSSPLLVVIVILLYLMQRSFLWKTPKERTLKQAFSTRIALPLNLITADIIRMQIEGLIAAANVKMPPLGLHVPFGLGLGLFLAIPWYQIYAYRRDIWWRRITKTIFSREVLIACIKVIGMILAFFIIVFGIVLGAFFIASKLPYYIRVSAGIILTIFAVYSYAEDQIKSFYWRFKDNKRTNQILNNLNLDRKTIASHFFSIKSDEGRLYFVFGLQDKRIKPTGEWPNAKLPNIRNDEASTLLAQLEEKWLGLSR